MTSGSYLVVTLFDDSYEAGFLCAASHEAYAKKHGYRHECIVLTRGESMQSFCEGRAAQWAKIVLLRRLLRLVLNSDKCIASEGPLESSLQASACEIDGTKLEWVVWIDADALVLNHNRRLEEFTGSVGARDLIISEDMSCASIVNTGVMLVRACTWSIELLDDVWACDSRLHHGPFHEQTALASRLREELEGSKEDEWFWSWRGGPQRKTFGHHVFVFDCGSLNYKHPEQAQFIVHFVDNPRNGPSKVDRLKRVFSERWIREACELTTLDLKWCKESARKARIRATWADVVSRGYDNEAHGWPAQSHSESSSMMKVEVCEHPSATVVLHYLQNHTPFITRSKGTSGRWTLSWLEEHLGESLVVVDALSPRRCSDGPMPSHRVKLWQFCDYARGAFPPLHPVLRRLDEGTHQVWQVTNWQPASNLDFEQLPLAEDFFLNCLETQQNDWVEVRLAPPGAIVRLHRVVELTHLVLTQMSGQTEVLLFHPRHHTLLRNIGPETFNVGQSAFDPWTCESSELPSGSMIATLREGESLTIPADWWYTSRALAPSALIARHIVNTSNQHSFSVRQQRLSRIQSLCRQPDTIISKHFSTMMRVCKAQGHAAWLASNASCRPLSRGDWCVVHYALYGHDGVTLLDTRMPDLEAASPRLVQVGCLLPAWPDSLASAALLAANGHGFTSVALTPAAIFAASPRISITTNEIVVELEVLYSFREEEGAFQSNCTSCCAPHAPFICVGCRCARYCSQVCQRLSWEKHKTICKSRKLGPKQIHDACVLSRQLPALPCGPGANVDPRKMHVTGDFGSRGIVICAGGPYLCLAWISLRILRDFCHSDLPVEIWHLSGEVTLEMSATFSAIPGVVLHELDVHIARKRPSIWAIKPLALAQSRFSEVLLLDADNIPILDPQMLFQASAYESHGAVFWPDYSPFVEKHGLATWKALSAGRWLERPNSINWEMESGQCLIDKKRSGHSLSRLVDLALHLDDISPYLPGDGGDKDLFQISWALTDNAFHMNVHQAAAAGIRAQGNPRAPDSFIGHTMVQYSLDGKPMFLHRTIDKHEDPFSLNWHVVAMPRLPATQKSGFQSTFALERIHPEGRIKVRIVPRRPEDVKIQEFEDAIHRGSELLAAFDKISTEWRQQTSHCQRLVQLESS